MNDWNDLKADYPTRLEPTDDDLNHVCATFDEWFVTLYQTERIIFAFWNEQIFFSYGFGRSWRYYSDNEVINPREFLDPFTYLDRLTELNPHKGTALFDGKAVKWNRKGKYWAYNNNYVVDFHKDTHSSADYSPTQPDDDDDTARVADLLQKTEETLTAVAEKLRSPIPTSSSAQETEETSQVPTEARQEPSQTATPPISSQGKGKQPLSRARASATSTTTATSSSLQTPQNTSVPSAPPRTTNPPAASTTPTTVPAPVPPPRNPVP